MKLDDHLMLARDGSDRVEPMPVGVPNWGPGLVARLLPRQLSDARGMEAVEEEARLEDLARDATEARTWDEMTHTR